MIVVMDIGNTNVAAAVYGGGKLIAVIRTRRPEKARRGWWMAAFNRLFTKARIATGEVSGAVICSVVPAASPLPAGILRDITGRRPLIVRGGLPLGLGIPYADPNRLGPDRVCAMLAAKKKHGSPVIVVDCGTAVTFDGIDRRGRHAGGMIAPGLEASARALSGATAALPLVRPALPERHAGRSTREALTTGIYNSVVGSVRENVGRLKKMLGGHPPVVGTGGAAEMLQRGGRLFDAVDPSLVLDGALIAHGIMAGRSASRRRGVKRATVSRRGGGR